jgi:long-subunit acyl-CoA synthetase (AMP-forming)
MSLSYTRCMSVTDDNQLVEAAGRAAPVEPPKIDRSSVATICYTSVRVRPWLTCDASHAAKQGTTGNPKGVVLSHAVQAAAVNAQVCGSPYYDGGAMISYLPLAHIYEASAISMARRSPRLNLTHSAWLSSRSWLLVHPSATSPATRCAFSKTAKS